MPNAGYPALEDGRTVYRNNAQYFARQMADIRGMGVRILGGCCGTTPEHIRLTAEALRQGLREHAAPRAGGKAAAVPTVPNLFFEKLASGRKVIAAEVDPPLDVSIAPVLAGAAALRDAGADIITVADSPLARPRADGVMVSSLIARRCGVEVMPHLACRDRNLNAMKALLLSAHIEDIRNVLVVTGDPIAEADRSEVKGVFNFHSRMLAGYIRDLNGAVFAGDGMRVGAALNVNATNLESELRRAEGKVAQGVDYFLTQPIFSPQAEEAFREAAARLGKPVLAALMPLVSHRNALFVANEVPGIRVPNDVVERFRGLKRAEAEQLGIALSADTARRLMPTSAGFFVITPLGRYGVTSELIRILRRECHD
jgi:homocysteine S-methyltransferase